MACSFKTLATVSQSKATTIKMGFFYLKKKILVELRAYQQKNKITIVDYSSKKQPAPILLNSFFSVVFALHLFFGAYFRATPGYPERLV